MNSQSDQVTPSRFIEVMPKKVVAEIEGFCNQIVSGQRPVFVSVKPKAKAQVSECQNNVNKQVEEFGGKALYGWIIWQSYLLLHAEFHSVWQQSDGRMVDITPKADGETKILFLPDPLFVWSGRTVPSRRLARHDHPLLTEFLAIAERIDAVRSKYLSGQQMTLDDGEAVHRLRVESTRLAVAITRLPDSLLTGKSD